MNNNRMSLRQLVAGVGVLTLALAGFVGASAAAAVAGGTAHAGSIDTSLTGSLTIHKHLSDERSEDGQPAGAALDGVVFQLQKISNVDLTTDAGWQTIEAAYAGQPDAAADVSGLEFAPTVITAPATGSGANPAGTTVVPGLEVAAYYVTEVGFGDNLITSPALPFIITIPQPNGGEAAGTWNYHPVAYPKNEVGTVVPTKTVGTSTTPTELGGSVDWTISVPLPKLAHDYTSFGISDDLVDGLEFEAWKSVTVGTQTLTAPGDFTVAGAPAIDSITFTPQGLLKLNGELAAPATGTTVTVVLTTKILALGIHTNQANVTVNGNVIPTDIPQINWAGLEITKTDSKTAALLDGAIFEVYAAPYAAGDTAIATGTTVDGKVRFGLDLGTSTTLSVVVKETRAPDGYVLPEDPFFGPYTLTAVLDDDETKSITVDTITNYKPQAPQLPLTGSTGTLLFMTIGLGLVGAGGALMVARRSRSKI